MQLYKNFCKETTDENGKLTSFELVFPENYNFGYDVVDKMAELVPNDTAVVWTNPEKEEKDFHILRHQQTEQQGCKCVQKSRH